MLLAEHLHGAALAPADSLCCWQMRMADASALIRQYCTRPATVVRLLYTMQNSWTSAIDHYMILTRFEYQAAT
jgi:hypothetical protein